MKTLKSEWINICLFLALIGALLVIGNLAASNRTLTAETRGQKLILEREKTKHLTDVDECVKLAQKRMSDLSAKWKEKFNKREEQVIKQDAALIQLHGDLVTVSAAFLHLRMKLPITHQLDREALILADETLGNRHITFDELVDQKWLQNRGENPVSALHYENYQF